jgi:hypothetical protein
MSLRVASSVALVPLAFTSTSSRTKAMDNHESEADWPDASRHIASLGFVKPVTTKTTNNASHSAEAIECAGNPGTHGATGTVGNVQSGGITCAVDPASK